MENLDGFWTQDSWPSSCSSLSETGCSTPTVVSRWASIVPRFQTLTLGRVDGAGEEDAAHQERGDERADALHSLGQVQADFGVAGRAADGEEGIGGGLEGRETRADDEHAAAEPSKGLLQAGGPEEQASDSEDGQAGNEGDAEAKPAQDPAGDGPGTDEVGTEVRSREA